jgi:hypothetical protein
MLRTRNLLSAAFGTLLLVVVAGPAYAGPAPLDETGTGSTPPAPPTSSGTDLWTYVGYAAAVLAVIAVVMVASAILSRQSHRHAAHPA